jgi:hypothetical protein
MLDPQVVVNLFLELRVGVDLHLRPIREQLHAPKINTIAKARSPEIVNRRAFLGEPLIL